MTTDQTPTPVEPTETMIDAAVAAFHEKLRENGFGGWTEPDDYRDEVTAALRAGMNA